MSQQTYTARVMGDDNEVLAEAEVTYDFGDSLDASAELFGSDVVHKRFVSQAVVDLQGVVRRSIVGKEPKSGKDLQAIIDDWKPGVQKARKSKTEKALDILSEMSEEEKLAFLAEMEAA